MAFLLATQCRPFLHKCRGNFFHSVVDYEGKFVSPHAMKANRGERNTAVIVSNLDTRWRKVIRFTHQPGD